MNKTIRKLLAPACAVAVLLVGASQSAFAWPGQGELDEPVGSATQQALDLQRSGALAAPAQPMSGDQASLAYDRYLKSFSQPIPVFFGSSLKSSDTASTGQ
jgi:Protein of unknown function (DUF3613)